MRKHCISRGMPNSEARRCPAAQARAPCCGASGVSGHSAASHRGCPAMAARVSSTADCAPPGRSRQTRLGAASGGRSSCSGSSESCTPPPLASQASIAAMRAWPVSVRPTSTASSGSMVRVDSRQPGRALISSASNMPGHSSRVSSSGSPPTLAHWAKPMKSAAATAGVYGKGVHRPQTRPASTLARSSARAVGGSACARDTSQRSSAA